MISSSFSAKPKLIEEDANGNVNSTEIKIVVVVVVGIMKAL